jgi:hypothetical protein
VSPVGMHSVTSLRESAEARMIGAGLNGGDDTERDAPARAIGGDRSARCTRPSLPWYSIMPLVAGRATRTCHPRISPLGKPVGSHVRLMVPTHGNQALVAVRRRIPTSRPPGLLSCCQDASRSSSDRCARLASARTCLALTVLG